MAHKKNRLAAAAVAATVAIGGAIVVREATKPEPVVLSGSACKSKTYENKTLKVPFTKGDTNRGRPILLLKGCENFTVRSVEIVGDRPSVGPVRKKGDKLGYIYEREANHAVSIRGGRNIRLENVRARNVWGDGLYLRDDAKGVTVTNSSFTEMGRQGIAIVDAQDVTITKSVVGNGSRTGVDFEANRDEDVIDNIRIIDNTFGPFYAKFMQYGGESANRISVIGNRPAKGYSLHLAYDTTQPWELPGWVVEGNERCTISERLVKTLVAPRIKDCPVGG